MENFKSLKDIVRFTIYIGKITQNFSSKPIPQLDFIYCALTKLSTLFKMQLKMRCIPDELFSFMIMKHRKFSESFVDHNLYVLCNSEDIDKSRNWFYLCCKSSERKYKVAIIHSKDVTENHIYVSESMKFNVTEQLSLEDDSLYFLFPICEEKTDCASEAKISLISNPHSCTENLINNLLQNFFSTPKYLRKNDIFKVNVKKYAPEIKYCAADLKLNELYFKVNSMKTENSNDENGSFVIYERSTLIQEANVNSYLPPKFTCEMTIGNTNFASSWPPALNDLLKNVQSCIIPFLKKDVCIDVKPVFLVEGPAGSGKSQLIKVAAETLGLNLLDADFSEVQSLTSAQTEAKLRILLDEAESCVPCILMLQNIQIFGNNAEGQKDERVLAAFSTNLNKLYSKKLKYPIIIMATSCESDIPIDTQSTFIEKITISPLEQQQKRELLTWLIEKRNLKHKADLQKIAKMCSDCVFADLDALVLHAIKRRFKICRSSEEEIEMELLNDDFLYACEHLQSMISNEIGAPRVPKVHWEDIGGLIDLKREIMRRIEMPSLNIPGMGRSGLLLYGPPGTGKTLLAKAVATECQLHFLSVKGPELLNMYVGQSEKNVRQVFERARAVAPCIIFFDELDSLAPNRGQSGDSGGVMDRVVSQLLAEMDGLESSGNIFIIAATNRPDLIDPALLRPGRFDKMLYVGIYSDPDSQMGVLKALTRKFKFENDAQELETLVTKLPNNLTGADLYSVCSNAWLKAVRRILTSAREDKDKCTADEVVVSLQDFLDSIKELVPSVSHEEMMRYEKLKSELSSR